MNTILFQKLPINFSYPRRIIFGLPQGAEVGNSGKEIDGDLHTIGMIELTIRSAEDALKGAEDQKLNLGSLKTDLEKTIKEGRTRIEPYDTKTEEGKKKLVEMTSVDRDVLVKFSEKIMNHQETMRDVIFSLSYKKGSEEYLKENEALLAKYGSVHKDSLDKWKAMTLPATLDQCKGFLAEISQMNSLVRIVKYLKENQGKKIAGTDVPWLSPEKHFATSTFSNNDYSGIDLYLSNITERNKMIGSLLNPESLREKFHLVALTQKDKEMVYRAAKTQPFEALQDMLGPLEAALKERAKTKEEKKKYDDYLMEQAEKAVH